MELPVHNNAPTPHDRGALNLDILTVWLHHLSIMTFFGALVTENLLLQKAMTPPEIRRLASVDSLGGAAFICAVLTGAVKLLKLGAGTEAYLRSWQFHTKMALVLGVFLVSIYPTIVLLKYRKAIKEMNNRELLNMPPGLKHGLRLELLLVALITLFAVAISRAGDLEQRRGPELAENIDLSSNQIRAR